MAESAGYVLDDTYVNDSHHTVRYKCVTGEDWDPLYSNWHPDIADHEPADCKGMIECRKMKSQLFIRSWTSTRREVWLCTTLPNSEEILQNRVRAFVVCSHPGSKRHQLFGWVHRQKGKRSSGWEASVTPRVFWSSGLVCAFENTSNWDI